MAIQAKTAEQVKESIAANKAKGFKPSTFEIELPEGNYEGISNGLYKDVAYTNANGKGLIIFACCEVENEAGEIVSIDVPIKESLVGFFNEDETMNFEVFRKDVDSPKRVKLLMDSDNDVNVNQNTSKIKALEEAIKNETNATKKKKLKAQLAKLV